MENVLYVEIEVEMLQYIRERAIYVNFRANITYNIFLTYKLWCTDSYMI